MVKGEILIHTICTSHTPLLQSIWCFTVNHRQFRTSTASWNSSILLNLSHSSVNELSTTSCMTLKNIQKSYRKTNAMACLKDMVESSPAKNTAFFQKVTVFLFFWFLFFLFWVEAIWIKKGRKRRITHFFDILSESTQIQLAFKHHFTCIATGNKPHTLTTFFKKL